MWRYLLLCVWSTEMLGVAHCDCAEGYALGDTRCRAAESRPSLLLATNRGIKAITLDHNHNATVVRDGSVNWFDYDFRTGDGYWHAGEKISKARMNESWSQPSVVITTGRYVGGLAVDWIYNRLYWTDIYEGNIQLCDMQGKHRQIIARNLESPLHIALDPLGGWMYWISWGLETYIERAGMDGSHRQIIVHQDTMRHTDLTLDFLRERLYWVDGPLKTISSCNYDGSARRVVLQSHELQRHTDPLSTFEDWIYWGNYNKNYSTIYRASKFDGSQIQTLHVLPQYEEVTNMAIVHPLAKPRGVNHCAADNGRCSHWCLPAPRVGPSAPRTSCACPDGLRLLPDNTTCAEAADNTRSAQSAAPVGGAGVVPR